MSITPEQLEELALAPKSIETDKHITVERTMADVRDGLKLSEATRKKPHKRLRPFQFKLGGAVQWRSE